MTAGAPRSRVLVFVSFVALALAGSAACGSRVEDAATTGLAPGVAPTTFVLATSSTMPLRDVTKSVPTEPTTAAAVSPSTTRTDYNKATFCAASRVYAIEDVIGLGTRVVGDPAGLLAAYETMVANAPVELAQPVEALGPITRQAVGLVQRGEVETAERLQTWLADSAPRNDLEQWVLAQQTIAPQVQTICR